MSKLSIISIITVVLILLACITNTVILVTNYPSTYVDKCPDPQYELDFRYNQGREEMYSISWHTVDKNLTSDQKWALKSIPHTTLKINNYQGYISFPKMHRNSDTLLSVIIPIFKEK